jgi:hypothetical protein
MVAQRSENIFAKLNENIASSKKRKILKRTEFNLPIAFFSRCNFSKAAT